MSQRSVTPPGTRLEKWDRRFNTERIKVILDEERPTMLVHAAAKFESLVAMEDAVKQCLNGQGTSAKDTASYLNFGRQVWKADQTYNGENLRIEVATVLGKWAARGLSQSVLEAIRDEVFTIGPPVGPV